MAARKRKFADAVNNGSFSGSNGPAKQPRRSVEDFREWTVHDVCNFLTENGQKDDHDTVEVFKREEICGAVLPDITEERLEKMGFRTMGKRLLLLKLLERFKLVPVSLENCKIFNDPIHGHIEMHPLCIKIIDTPQFQRLRFIKQLGACYWVFPGASHNRFEHCLGVYHLAGCLVKTLRKRQPELGISDVDVLCVEIAGLCHDLGHGPFSHFFDGQFIPLARPGFKWKHEHASVQMFDHLIEQNDLKNVFLEYNVGERDLIFIKEQIAGPLAVTRNQAWPYKGRDEEKSFLYEVVANKRNGIDVDKWDYFARDCHHLGISNKFDHMRFMKFARVINVDGRRQICTRDKECSNLYDMFHTRSSLHRRAYQHKANKCVEIMIVEALLKADKYIRIPGKDGAQVKLSETPDDMHAYTKLTDHIFQQVLYSQQPELEEARSILRDVESRRLYRCVGQTRPQQGCLISQDEAPSWSEEIVTSLTEEELGAPQLSPGDIAVSVVDMDYGMGDKNPIDHVRFYDKSKMDNACRVRKEEVSQMLPETFAEQHIRVYCKKRDQQSIDIAERCFIQWCDNRQDRLKKPKGGKASAPELTPLKKDEVEKEDGASTSASPPTRHDSVRSRLSL
ncbi:deoxynucleoside triphosphate triphosphohydrolase SAMHD1-like [Branchiostoma floridae]|uniref:Deoxynucleoside triphosphate triphosphohydrolase SAMHD1 n=1 Tax=Branchiostoma floridae TaxID=7739 RepID=A0A9J7MVG9_BRAFL|nr:deoxynucleoside triphosphate triphosphohydrolase SAMHD1-like [Branchiostoma floridae]